MSASVPDNDRHLVPRWRQSNEAIKSGELVWHRGASTRRRSGPEFDERLAEWRSRPSIEVAAELVATSVVVGRQSETMDAAKFLLQSRNGAMPLVKEMALTVLGQAQEKAAPRPALSPGRLDPKVVYSNISSLRSRLRRFPRDAFAWVDLARLYTVLGQLAPAERAITNALAISPNDRFVLRSGSRFFLHADDKEQALAHLQRSSATQNDPWLMAAEISFAQILNRRSRTATMARRRVSTGDWHPRSESELQGALATMLMKDGSGRSARKMFQQSLIDPTENAVAQAQWASGHTEGLVVPSASLSGLEASEARALKARGAESWSDVISECWSWAELEPTSVRSMIMGSFTAGVALQDASTVIEFAKRGLTAEPTNFSLLNNLIVGLIYQGNLDLAYQKILELKADTGAETVAVFALQGLLKFRSGDHSAGRGLYDKAIQHPEALRNARIRSLALWHLAQEEAAAKTEFAAAAIISAEVASRPVKLPELNAIRERLMVPSKGGSGLSKSRIASLANAIRSKASRRSR